MGGEQSKLSSTSPHGDAKEKKEPELFLVDCEPEELDRTVTSDRLGDGDTISCRRSSAEVRASWEAPSESSRSSLVFSTRRSSSEQSRVTSRPSRTSSDRGSCRAFELVHCLSTTSQESSDGNPDRSAINLAQQFQSTETSLETLPEDGDLAYSEWRTFTGDNFSATQEHPTTAVQPGAQLPQLSVGIEQVLPLYLQLTNKTENQLTPEDVAAISQLAANPHLLLSQLLPLASALSPPQPQPTPQASTSVQPNLACQVSSHFYGSLSDSDRELLEQYQSPQPSEPVQGQAQPSRDTSSERSDLPTHQYQNLEEPYCSNDLYAALTEEERAQLQTPIQPAGADFYSTLSAEERALLEQYQSPDPVPSPVPIISKQEQLLQSAEVEETAADPFGSLTEEEKLLLEQYQNPGPSTETLLDPYASLTPEQHAVLNQQQFVSPEDAFNHITDEELAIIGGSPLGNAFLAGPSQTPFLIQESLQQQQALLAAQASVYCQQELPSAQVSLESHPCNPFENLTPEERAILGEPCSPQHKPELSSGASTQSSSATEEEVMEPPRQDTRFTANISSFYTPGIHPSAVADNMLPGSNRSSGTRSSFAEERRHVRPSMEIAGGQFTRASDAVQDALPPMKSSIDNFSRASEASSQNITPELPSGFPLTALPPIVPPPPPTEPPTSLLTQPKSLAETEARPATMGVIDPTAIVHERMERLNIIRSSFAAERKSLDSPDDNRGSKLFSDVPDTGKISITTESLASELHRRYQHLAVIPDDMPFPLTLLCMLWGAMRPVPIRDAEAAAWVMDEKKVMRVASLEDGSIWCMINADHAAKLRQKMQAELPEMHSRLVNLYRQGFHDLALVPDDNYFMQNIAYHLTCARRLPELAVLLCDAIWLETKLRSYGTGPVVSDFRRFFNCSEDPNVTLMLRAFQISANGSIDHSSLYILKEQMLGRLMIAAKSNPGIREWYEQGVKEWQMAVPYRKSRSMPVHLLAKTPSLEQAGGLQRLILKGHTGGIQKVQLAPNGLEVITASCDGSIRVWDMEIGDFVLKMDEHEGAVTCFTLSKDGRILVSGGEDGVGIVYDLPSGIWRHKLCGHTKRINAIAIDPRSRRVVTSSQDTTTRIWSLANGTCLHVLCVVAGASGSTWEEWAGHHDMAISPDARIVATVDAEFRIRVWMIETASLTDTLEGHSDWVVSLSFAGDSGLLLTASHDRTLRLWDLWRGYCEHVFEGHRGRINNLKVTDDGSRAVSVSDDAVGIVWNVKERCKVCELVGHGAWINDAAITQDGQRVITVSGDELGIVWDGNTGELLRILKGHSGEINGAAVSYKGRFAITASSDTTARVWDLSSPSTHLEDVHTGRVTKILYHPGAARAVTIGEDSVIMIWDLSSCRCTRSIPSSTNINHAFLVSEGTQLITASGDRYPRAVLSDANSTVTSRCICVWDLDSGECVRTLPSHNGSRLKSITVSPDGSLAVIVLFDSTVTIWNLQSMTMKEQLMKRGDRNGVHVHSAAVNEVVMTLEGRQALTVSKDYTARLWDLEAFATVITLRGHEDSVDLVSVKDDGSACMTASYDRTARLWDLRNGDCTMVLDHPKEIDFLAVDSQWRRAVTIAGASTAWLWDIARGRCLGILESEGDHLSGAVFSADGRFLATYSSNAVVRVWTASSGKLRAVYLADTGISACQFAGNEADSSSTLLVGDGNGHVHFLEFPANELASVQRRKH